MDTTVRQSPGWYRAGQLVCGAAARLLGGLEVHGLEHVPATGACILVCNHLSHVDPPLLAVAVRRYTFFMAKEELFRPPFLGWYLTRIGAFPVRRGTPDRTALRRALQVLEAGQMLGMFPEGRRSDTGRLQPGEEGVGLIALRSRAPILPAAITGSEKVLPPGRAVPHCNRVCVRFGPPFHLDDLYERRGSGTLALATQQIMAVIADLLPPEYRPEQVAQPTP